MSGMNKMVLGVYHLLLVLALVVFFVALLALHPEVPLSEAQSPWLDIADSVDFWISLIRRTWRLLIRWARIARSKVLAMTL